VFLNYKREQQGLFATPIVKNHPFYEEVKIAKCCLAYKRINDKVPVYLEDHLILNSQCHSRNTRYCKLNLNCPKFNRKTEGGRTFVVTTCQLWNSLNINLRNSKSLKTFKNSYRDIIFNEQHKLSHFNVA